MLVPLAQTGVTNLEPPCVPPQMDGRRCGGLKVREFGRLRQPLACVERRLASLQGFKGSASRHPACALQQPQHPQHLQHLQLPQCASADECHSASMSLSVASDSTLRRSPCSPGRRRSPLRQGPPTSPPVALALDLLDGTRVEKWTSHITQAAQMRSNHLGSCIVQDNQSKLRARHLRHCSPSLLPSRVSGAVALCTFALDVPV